MSERIRLLGLVEGLTSLEQAIDKFGPPDVDAAHGVLASLKSGAHETSRTLTYRSLSDYADLRLVDASGRIRLILSGKKRTSE